MRIENIRIIDTEKDYQALIKTYRQNKP